MIYLTFALLAALAIAVNGATPGASAPSIPAADFLLIGAVVNQGTLQTLGRSFKAIFAKAYDLAERDIMKLAMQVQSTNAVEEYGWLSAMSELREWIGDRQIEKLAVEGYTLRNRKFEKTVAIAREDIEDDRVGMYEPRIQMLATLARRHPGALITDLLQAGETNPCYDAAEFFDPSHPNGEAGTYSNLLTTAPLTTLNYEAGRETMMSYRSENGETLGLVPDTLIVPPQLEKEAREILSASAVIEAGTADYIGNIWHGSANLIVEPRLANQPTEWYLAALNMPFKPFIFQTRRAVELKSLDNPDDPNVFFKDEYLYGVDYRGAAGYGLPHLIVKGRA